MDKAAIEDLSVSAVQNSLSVCDYLQPFIAKNDKEPSFDGSVYIYKNSSKKKDSMIGRVPVQVKGKECDDFKKDEISYSVKMVDLNNYLNEGGIIFFVVYVMSEKSKKIYYETLLPVRIRMIQENAKGQQTKKIKLKEFPDDNKSKANIFLNFYENKVKQSSFVNKKFLSFEDLQKPIGIKGLLFSVSGFGYKKGDEIDAILENEIYLYAEMNEACIPIPIDMVPKYLCVQQHIPCDISVKEKHYYSSYTRTESIDSLTIEIGQSLKLVSKKIKDNRNLEKLSIHFSFNSVATLRSTVKDTEFFLDAFKTGSFTINGSILKLPEFEQKVDIQNEEKRLEYYRNMLSVLDILHVKEDLNIETMTKQEHREMNNLITAFVDRKPTYHLKKDLPIIIKIRIQNIVLLLVTEPLNREEGIYNIKDYFGSNIGIFYDIAGSTEKIITSQYSILQKEDYLSISNINYDAILPSYQILVEDNPDIFDRATMDMLNMISAYDENHNGDLLESAKKIAYWILKQQEINTNYIDQLNYLQIVRRQRELDEDENKQLCSITEDGSIENEQIKTGAYLLLGNQKAAKIYFERLDTETQKAFKLYPIYKFWDKDKAN